MTKKAVYFFLVSMIGTAVLGCANVNQHVTEGNQQTLLGSAAKDMKSTWGVLVAGDKEFQKIFW